MGMVLEGSPDYLDWEEEPEEDEDYEYDCWVERQLQEKYEKRV